MIPRAVQVALDHGPTGPRFSILSLTRRPSVCYVEPMPAFSLYITDDRLARLQAESKRKGVSVAKVVADAVDSYLSKEAPALACVGRDGVSWTGLMPLEDALKAHQAAVGTHPGIVVYRLPEGSTVAQGLPVPAGAVPL